jgi:hypothetical protein
MKLSALIGFLDDGGTIVIRSLDTPHGEQKEMRKQIIADGGLLEDGTQVTEICLLEVVRRNKFSVPATQIPSPFIVEKGEPAPAPHIAPVAEIAEPEPAESVKADPFSKPEPFPVKRRGRPRKG